MRGEGVGKPQHGGELGAEQAGAEDPDWDVQAFAGNGPDATSVFRRFEILHQLDDIARNSNGVAVEGAAERVGGRLVRRSEERRVGNECVSTCRSRWWRY